MRQRITVMVLVALVAVLMPLAPGVAAVPVEWTTRGGDEAHSQTSRLDLGAIAAVPAWANPPAVGLFSTRQRVVFLFLPVPNWMVASDVNVVGECV